MKVIIYLVLSLFWVLPLQAAEHSHHTSSSIELPEDISALLQQEMQQIRKGMESLTWLVASGDFAAVAKVGHDLKNGYVMKQKLSHEQIQVLISRLPAEFKALDARFHKQAGLLAVAAKNHDAELVNFYIYKMNEGCVACHSTFVADRFTGFTRLSSKEHHSH